MNIYYVERVNGASYDEYDNFICFAENEEDARSMILGYQKWERDTGRDIKQSSWPEEPEDAVIDYLGVADSRHTEAGIICASFNAG